jgi:hypothetical protein
MNHMKRTQHLALAVLALGITGASYGQRYLNEVFTNAQITVTPDVLFATNIDFFTSNLGSPLVPQNAVELQTLVSQGQPIPPAYFNPGDPSTGLKVTNLRYDLYEPTQGTDNLQARPFIIYLHTGNLLPVGINQSTTGSRKDSTAVEICSRLARRGYVVAALSYRLGWNPAAPTEEQRRGQLLNAVYRAMQDTRHLVRTMKADAAGSNTYKIDPNKIIVFGEGTGGYIALANATLDKGAELFIEKFRPDPFNPNVSYVDTTVVGNIAGLGGSLNLYRPNGFDYTTHMSVNFGGALADNSWLEDGDQPMVSFHCMYDPFAPFTQGIVIVPTTQGPVVEVNGPNTFMPRANQFGNNAAFATLPNDAFSTAARSRYGNTYNGVTLDTNLEGLMPFNRPRPAQGSGLFDEASPWQFWDPNSAVAQQESSTPGVTIGQASLASNPDMSPTKARAYIDTIMGYSNPRIVCALQLGPCSLVSIDENDPIAAGVELYPNPANDRFTVLSSAAAIRNFELFDINGRLVRAGSVNTDRLVIERQGLEAGVYFVHLQYATGTVTRRVVLE